MNPRAALDELKGKDKLSQSQAELAQRLTAAQVLVMGRKGERMGGREGGRERVRLRGGREEGKDGGEREGSGSRG